jgi:hypothetical protein
MAIPAQGDHVRVLEQQELIGNQTLFAISGELLLQI